MNGHVLSHEVLGFWSSLVTDWAALRGAIQTHLLQIGSSTDRGGLIVLHDQLHHAATAAGQWQFVRIITPPAAAAYLSRGLPLHWGRISSYMKDPTHAGRRRPTRVGLEF